MKHFWPYVIGLAGMMMIDCGSVVAVTSGGAYYATPSWDQTLPCDSTVNCPRFVVLSNMGSNAALDRETGLVWDLHPLGPFTSIFPGEFWIGAQNGCLYDTRGERYGWRLPTVQELASLIDLHANGPAVPPGSPFQNISSDPSTYYWTSSADPGNSSNAYAITFSVPAVQKSIAKTSAGFYALCVRGGEGINNAR